MHGATRAQSAHGDGARLGEPAMRSRAISHRHIQKTIEQRSSSLAHKYRSDMTQNFVATKVTDQSEERYEHIRARKEAERTAGNGEFWWGIGVSLGSNGIRAAKDAGEQLPVIFVRNRTHTKQSQVPAARKVLWTKWESEDGEWVDIPLHVVITSAADKNHDRQHALVCRREDPIKLGGTRIDLSKSLTIGGGRFDKSQLSTALLSGDPLPQPDGQYFADFDAELVNPYCPRLGSPRELRSDEYQSLIDWREGHDWLDLVGKLRGEEHSSVRHPAWERDELLLALDLYLQDRPRLLDKSDAKVVELSGLLNRLPLHPERGDPETFRNPTGVAMKLANFAHLDSEHDGDGLSSTGKGTELVWMEYSNRRQDLALIAQAIRETVDLGDLVDSEEEGEDEVDEGRLLYRRHRVLERSQKLSNAKKRLVLERDGKLDCEVCGFDFVAKYGEELGGGFIEAHHVVPLSSIGGPVRSSTKDLALVCSNCHRMIHRSKQWLTPTELMSRLRISR